MSARSRRTLVSHSAGDTPPALIEAELFGNRQDYPNPGTPGREGLIGREGEGKIAERFAVPMDGGRQWFRISIGLMDALVRHQYALNVRELEQQLLVALYASPGDQIELTKEVESRLRPARPKVARIPETTPCETIEKTLDEHGWNIVETARALGWSRFQLNRKMKKCGLVKARESELKQGERVSGPDEASKS
jgi:DNA-binding NtrC family response regulator